MKKLLLIFLLLPVLSFSQDTSVTIDSISLITYNGSSSSKKSPVLSRSIAVVNEDYKSSAAEIAAKELRIQKELLKEYPNYDAERDMPLPIQTKMILDKNGKFHPSARWETYQTFAVDSVAFLVDILNCAVPSTYGMDSIKTIDALGNETVIVSHRKPTVSAMCFAPDLGILVWSKDKITTFYSVCFYCSNVKESAANTSVQNFKDCIYLDLLEDEVKALGYLKVKK